MNRSDSYRTLVVVLLGGSLAASCPGAKTDSNAGGAAGMPGPRVLHFPADRSLGRLMIRPVRPEEPIDAQLYWVRDQGWEVLGPAQGEVAVPAGSQLFLRIHDEQAWRDLAPLAALAPDDLYSLDIQGSYGGGPKPGDSCMTHLAHLTGLHSLDLRQTSITGVGLKHVTGMKNVRELAVPTGMDDQGMACIGRLTSLRSLYFKENRVTNGGLAHLAKLQALEELELGGGQINNAGLVCLAELPQLRYLILWGKGFSDAGLARLKNVKSLETLNLGALEQITDVGLAQLAEIPQLKDLDLYHCKDITDAGLAPLKKLPGLRILKIANSQVTDEGLAHLKEIKTLEGLMLPGKGITDRGLQYLSELPRLRELWLPRAHYVDPTMDKDYYTDEGLKALSSLTSLESLDIGSLGITDEGIKHLAALTRLKKLSLFGCSRITDESLRTIGRLRSLETLSISHGYLTISGLKMLNRLTNLKNLDLNEVIQDDSGLDLSGLTGLEDLMLSLARRRTGSGVVSSPFREQDIATLGKLTRLKRLQISHGGATSASLGYLTGLSRLERLSIGGDGLTDEGLAHLTGLSRLNSLTLSGHFTDAALLHLQKLPDLGMLDFFRSGPVFSQAAVSDFQRNMPRLTVFRGFETSYAPRRTQPPPRPQRR
jgi:Leucine-rich repeat (LRR) protein